MSCENAKIALLLGKFADDLFLGSTEIYLGQCFCEPHIDKALTCGDLEFFFWTYKCRYSTFDLLGDVQIIISEC